MWDEITYLFPSFNGASISIDENALKNSVYNFGASLLKGDDLTKEVFWKKNDKSFGDIQYWLENTWVLSSDVDVHIFAYNFIITN